MCEMSAIVWQFEHSLALSFFGIGMKTDLFQSCGHWRRESKSADIEATRKREQQRLYVDLY